MATPNIKAIRRPSRWVREPAFPGLSMKIRFFGEATACSGHLPTIYTPAAKGCGIHWPSLDEDISVPGLLGLPD